MRNYGRFPNPISIGNFAEKYCQKALLNMGYEAIRTLGSRGPFDIIAWNKDEILYIQVKAMRIKKNSILRNALNNLIENSPSNGKCEVWFVPTSSYCDIKYENIEIFYR